MPSRPSVAPANRLDTHQKALAVNLDPRRYGTFAEIGAGQEVVRWFFRVGGAAGTIAKSISAYDMEVSDAIYGRAKRYVCRQRLEKMLDYEHQLNLERLKDTRGDTTAFFTFADTVSAKSYRGTNDSHAWMGVRFQAHPRDQDSRSSSTSDARRRKRLQQEPRHRRRQSLYGAFSCTRSGARSNRCWQPQHRPTEIDMIEFSGIDSAHVDNRAMSACGARPVARGDVGPTARCCSRPRFSTRSRFWSSAAVSSVTHGTSTCCVRARGVHEVTRGRGRRRGRADEIR